MDTKAYKKIYGTVLYLIQQLGYDIMLGSFVNNKQVFTVNKTYLKDFYFVLSVDESNTNNESVKVKLYALGKYIQLSDEELNNLDSMCWLRFVITMYDFNIPAIQFLYKFLQSFKKHKKYYLYNCWIREYDDCKKLSKRQLNRFYKNVRLANK